MISKNKQLKKLENYVQDKGQFRLFLLTPCYHLVIYYGLCF
jgi:hypothetical protein